MPCLRLTLSTEFVKIIQMNTKVRGINNFSLKQARKLILSGELVAFPTETVYGLGANAFDDKAIDKIFKAKGRPQDNPLIVHIADKNSIPLIAKNIGEDAKKIIDAFMPGSITVVLNKKGVISDKVTAGLDTVAVRMPKSEQARKFIAFCGAPIAAPSANASGRPSPTTAADVFADMQGKIPLILKGKKCAVGIESTVVDCTGDVPVILRPGAVTQSMIESVLNKNTQTLTDTTRKVNSPGVRYKHYAPNCPCVLNVDGDVKKVKTFVDKQRADGANPVIFCPDNYKQDFDGYKLYLSGKDEYAMARSLYRALRKAEKIYDYIVIVWPYTSEFAQSVYNRLIRVANHTII